MKIIFTLILTLFCFNSFSQSLNRDYLVTRKNDTIFCEIIGLKGKMIEFIGRDNKNKTENIFNFLDVKITDNNNIVNPLGLRIEKPEPGYAHIYFYRPYVYTGSALPCNIEYNGKKFINIKTYSYYLHKVKAGGSYV